MDVPPPPAGDVSVIGHVRPSQRKGRFFSPSDPADGVLQQLYRVDVPRIAQQVPYPLLPVYVELISVDPPVDEGSDTGGTVALPVPVPPPEQGDGPHLAYAGQWVLFSACAVVGWVIVVRRRARAARPTATT
jgi:surfeit locus 1 family protein